MFKGVLPEATKITLRTISPVIIEWDFYLAGGSGLSLQFRHRISEDLDFFRKTSFDSTNFFSLLKEKINTSYEILLEKDTVIAMINDIRVSFFKYDIPLLFDTISISIENIIVADWRDIIAEKFKKIAQRGSKKDFFDLYEAFISNKITIEGAVRIFKRRFESTGINFYHVLRSLTYFEDADREPDPRSFLKISHKWSDIKNFFIENIRIFESYMIQL